MADRFKRGAHHVRLVNEDAEGELDDSNTAVGEDDKKDQAGKTLENDEEGGGKERHYVASDVFVEQAGKRKRGREVTLCGRKFALCGVNSWGAILLVLFVFSMAVSVSVIISKLVKEPQTEPPTETPAPSQGAVAMDSAICADMSAAILVQNGSAVDAAITGMLCTGVVYAESSGIGGGGFMVVRLANGSVYALNFREKAPAAATEDMSTASRGVLSVAVPGEVRGMEKAHELFGRLPWEELFKPVVKLCRNGHPMTKHAAKALSSSWDNMSPNLQAVYTRQDGQRMEMGDNLTRPDLADTLEVISKKGGVNAFYTGDLAQSIVKTVKDGGGILTMEDLGNYTVKMETPLSTQFGGNTFYSAPVPSGGTAFLFMLSLMELYHHDTSSNSDLVYHRLVESFKFAFAERTRLGDPYCVSKECQNTSEGILQAQKDMFNATYVKAIWANITDDRTHNTSYYHPHFSSPADSGTAHLSVLAPDGDAVSVTSTINWYFGSDVMTATGVVLNNQMHDFSSPKIAYGIPPNFIRPGKRPLSSTCPAIAVTEVDGKQQVSMVIGAAGGSTIPTAVANAVIRSVTFGNPISTAIEWQRIHHQLVPEVVQYETDFPSEILAFLRTRGHNVTKSESFIAVVQGIVVDGNGCTTAHGDSRKQGKGVVIPSSIPPCGSQTSE